MSQRRGNPFHTFRSYYQTALSSRLGRRQVRVVLVVALTVGSVLSCFQILVDYRTHRKTMEQDLTQLINSTINSATSAAWQVNADLAIVVCEGIAAHPAISYCSLELSNGFQLGEVTSPSKSVWLGVTSGIFGGERLIHRPMTRGQVEVGTMNLKITPVDAINDFSRRALVIIGAGIVRAFILSLILFAVFYNLTTQPLVRLSRFLGNINPGDKDDAIPPIHRHRYPDEMRDLESSALSLAKTVSAQVSELQLAKRSLELANKTLEERVEARTRDLEQAMKALKRQAQTDSLTGLYNRHVLFESASGYLDNWSRYGECFAVLLVDIDHFKSINDRFGHDIGDKAIVAVARRLRQNGRPGDLVTRFGGEEFVVLVKVTCLQEAMDSADRLREELAATRVDDLPLTLTASIGVAIVQGTDDTIRSLIKRADEALYQAKAGGRNLVVAN